MKMGPFHLICYLLVLIFAHVVSESNIIEGLCSWTVRSRERTIPASVYPVNFYACRTGDLTWEQPYGGVQMTFQSEVPLKTVGTYEVCITSKNSGFDIFVRNKDSLKLLRSHEAKNITSELCVRSPTRNLIIYVESGKYVNSEKSVFTYRTIFLANGKGSLRPKDCKICSRQELIKSFCSSDFAVHGNVKSVTTIGGSQSRGEAVVVAKKILHQTANIFQKSSDGSEIVGNVNFPLYCHWKKRSKHGYLFTGNLKDGEGPVIHCRIKFGLWRRLYHRNICDQMRTRT